jgi:hypothetical protein
MMIDKAYQLDPPYKMWSRDRRVGPFTFWINYSDHPSQNVYGVTCAPYRIMACAGPYLLGVRW